MYPLCQHTHTHVPVVPTSLVTDLVVEDLLNEQDQDDDYIDDSGDDLEEMREDEELNEIMESVFGPECDEEDT